MKGPRRALRLPLYLALLSGALPAAQAGECVIQFSAARLQLEPLRALHSGAAHPAAVSLAPRETRLTSQCPASAIQTLVWQGPRQGERFRFADQGQMRVQLSQATLDGHSVDLALSERLDAAASTLAVHPGDAVVAVRQGRPAAGQLLSLRVELLPHIPSQELQGGEARTLQTQLTVHVRTD